MDPLAASIGAAAGLEHVVPLGRGKYIGIFHDGLIDQATQTFVEGLKFQIQSLIDLRWIRLDGQSGQDRYHENQAGKDSFCIHFVFLSKRGLMEMIR